MFSKILNVISPILYGIALAYLLSPIQNFFEEKLLCFPSRKRWQKSLKRGLAVVMTMLVLLAVAVAIVLIFVPSIATCVEMLNNNLGVYLQELEQNLERYLNRLNPDGVWGKLYAYLKRALDVDENKTLLSQLTPKIAEWLTGLLSSENLMKIFSVGSSVVSALIDLVVVLIFTIYLLISKERQAARVKKLLAAFCKPERVERIYRFGKMTDERVGRYLRVQVLDSILVGVVSYIVYVIIGVPLAPLLALISGVTNIIPYFGPFIGGIPNGLLVLLAAPEKLLPFIISVLIIQQIDGNILVPIMQSTSMQMDTFWVLAGITVMGGFFGLPGMIVGVPFFAVLYVLAKEKAEARLQAKNLPVSTDSYLTYAHEHKTEHPTPPLVRTYRKIRNWVLVKAGRLKPEEEKESEQISFENLSKVAKAAETKVAEEEARKAEKRAKEKPGEDLVDSCKAKVRKVADRVRNKRQKRNKKK